MNELYYGSHELPDLDDIDYMIGDGIPLQAKLLSFRGAEQRRISNTSAESTLAFSEEVLIEALKRIYSQKFHPMDDIEEHLFEETLRLMLQATDEGMAVSGAAIDKEFRTLVDWNTARWSAFKVHRMQNDIASQLYDEDGQLKPFDRWAKDVEPMLDHHVGHWLRTEYNTAVTRAQQAADWKRFEENADIMPNLTWIPSTSAQPGADHKIYWGVTLPIDHPFWNSHRPGDRWGCKCSLENTDDEPTSVPDDPNPKQNRPADGLDNNPGKDGKLFGDSHPYIKNASRQAKKAVEKYMESRVDLPKPIKVKETKEERRERLIRMKDDIVENCKILEIKADVLETGVYYEDATTMERGIYHARNEEEIMMFRDIHLYVDKLKGPHFSPLGEVKDMDNPKDAKNVAKKKKRGVTGYNVYEVEIGKTTWLVKMEIFKDKSESAYNIMKKK